MNEAEQLMEVVFSADQIERPYEFGCADIKEMIEWPTS